MSAASDWRKELAGQRHHHVSTAVLQREAWAIMLDATSTLALADQLVKKLPRASLRVIVSEWLTTQDFVDAMNGVAGDES